MTALKMEELVRLEKQYDLEPDGLSYQHRCSRITAYQKGEGDSWRAPEKAQQSMPTTSKFTDHPLYGKRILITPMMVPDAKRNLAFDEPLGPDIIVDEYNAGEEIYGSDKDVQRMVGDYVIKRVDHSHQVVAKTTFPKIGTEISWMLGKELCPVVRGNDNKEGYIWSFPTSVLRVPISENEYSLLQVYGLKTLIRTTYPELEVKFSGKPMMDYIDGVTLVASIPQTHTVIKDFLRKEQLAQKAGLDLGYGF